MGILEIRRKMKLLGFLAASASAGIVEHPLFEQFKEWKNQFGKVYSTTAETTERFEKWLDNHQFVLDHNIRYLMNEETFQVEMNHLADLSEAEFAEINKLRNGPRPESICTPAPKAENDANPADVDWRTKGYVNPIKNQGHCGSCWAFSTVGSMEGAHFKKTGKLVSLSEQNLVDCAKPEGNHGCEGGLMDFGFTYIKKNGGIDTEESYPYTAKDGTCKFKKETVGAQIESCFDIERQDEKALEDAVATIGPVSVAMDAHLRSFQLYRSGIYHDKMCSSTKLDHGVLAVGYHNADSGETGKNGSYWIVRNSWGPEWGNKGYFWLAKDKKNACGIASAASYPIASA